MKTKTLRALCWLLTLSMLLSGLMLVTSYAEDGEPPVVIASPDVDLDNDPGTLTYTVSADGATVTVSYTVGGETLTYTVPNRNNYTAGSMICTDDLGRTMYTSSEVGAYGTTGEKYVGLFYFLWQGEHDDTGVFDLQKIIDDLGVEAAGDVSGSHRYGGVGQMHWFAEPLYGYYYANDEWVHTKHMELLTLANVDFLYFDVTNGYYYLNNALQVMKACHDLNEAGFDAPQVVFYTHSNSNAVVKGLYGSIYSKDLYKDTWFCIDGKPVIIAPYEDNVKNFFYIKREQWPNEASHDNSWPWMDFEWPQRLFTGLDESGNPDGKDAISVSVAQHSGNITFSTSSLYGYTNNRGRSFTYKTDNGRRTNIPNKVFKQCYQSVIDDPTVTYQGLNFQDQFDRAIESGATYILVTGWNEWVAQRQPSNSNQAIFVDTASMEYSRDCEMMRGGYFDAYYIQLAYNIQRIKGADPVIVQDARHAIDVSGDFSQWDAIDVTYRDGTGDMLDRNGKGFGRQTYTNTTGNNDIVAAKVTSDTKNLYFYVETKDAISAPDTTGDSSWMQLFLNTDNDASGWYGFDYIVNFLVKGSSETTVAKYVGTKNAYDFAVCGTVSYKLEGNKLMIAVPQTMVGIEENHYREICLQFKWADSDSCYDTMEKFYEDGDAAPIGRINFVYQNYIPGIEVLYPELETEPETEPETDPVTDAPATDAQTEAPATDAPTEPATDAPTEVPTGSVTPADSVADDGGEDRDTGCTSVIGCAALVLTAMAAAFVLGKKRD